MQFNATTQGQKAQAVVVISVVVVVVVTSVVAALLVVVTDLLSEAAALWQRFWLLAWVFVFVLLSGGFFHQTQTQRDTEIVCRSRPVTGRGGEEGSSSSSFRLNTLQVCVCVCVYVHSISHDQADPQLALSGCSLAKLTHFLTCSSFAYLACGMRWQ